MRTTRGHYKFGLQYLSCKKRFDKEARHEIANDLYERALWTCGFAAMRTDGEKPDGLALIL